MSPYTKYRW